MKFLSDTLFLIYDRFDFFCMLIIQHLILSIEAISIICLIGVSLGIYISRHKELAGIVINIANFIYTIPSIALFGILIAVTGIGDRTALIALVVYGVLPVIRNTYVGISEVDSQIVESAVAMGSTGGQLLYKIQLPLAMPVIVAGFRTMVVMTISLGAIASFIGAGGLGVAIWRGITTNYPEMTAAGSILVAVMAIGTDAAIGVFERKLSKRAYK